MPRVDVFAQHNEAEAGKTRIVMLTLTEDCNLRCRYCYEPTKSRDRAMTLEVAQKVITEYMEMQDKFENLEFDFFGGEPMLAFPLIHQILDWFHSREWSKNHLFFLGTNGTILTEEMKHCLLHYNCLQVGISLDGNKTAHDLNRSNSYDRLMQNLPFFLEHWPDQPLKMTISAETIPHVADSIIEMEEKGLIFSANVVYENIWGAPEQKEALLETYAEQLDRLVEYYAAHPHLYPARPVGHQVELATRPAGAPIMGGDCVRWCGAGHEMVMVDTEGNRFPCHRFAPWVTGRPAPLELTNRQAQWKPEKCAECKILDMCPVCAGFNWQENGDSGIRTTYHCEALKLEVLASAKLEALKLLQQSPKEITQLPPEKAYAAKRRLEAVLEFASAGA
jgi:radical SAM protein with 4Fe4S-binding SPASM domain